VTVSIHNLRFSYDKTGHDPILEIPEWSVAAGEHVFLHGPSGSGKSTLLNLLAGILATTEGSIKILDQSLDLMSERQRDKFRANHIGLVFQQFNLIHYLSALDNIRLANHFTSAPFRRKTDSRANAKELLKTLGINAALHNQPASTLSTGQQQRVAIARSLINTPELLIVDEPTSALDSQSRDAFMTILMEIVTQHNITLIFVSHDQSLTRYFSRTVALQEINVARGNHSCLSA
jgi:putative ABC transport system ATP-binding protein